MKFLKSCLPIALLLALAVTLSSCGFLTGNAFGGEFTGLDGIFEGLEDLGDLLGDLNDIQDPSYTDDPLFNWPEGTGEWFSVEDPFDTKEPWDEDTTLNSGEGEVTNPSEGMDEIYMELIVFAREASVLDVPYTFDGNVLDTLSEGARLSAYAEDDEWYAVNYEIDAVWKTGYISKNLVADVTPILDFESVEAISYEVAVDSVSVRSYPSSAVNSVYAVRGTLSRGDKVTCVAVGDGWMRIRYVQTVNGEEITSEYYLPDSALERATTEGLLYETMEDGTLCVIGAGLAGNQNYIKVPAEVDGVAVTAIGDGAFYACRGVQEIVLPDSIVSIGEQAFYSCTALQSINLPTGLTEIADETFFECTSLSSIEIPAGVEFIGERAFSNCHSLTRVVLPEGLETVSEGCFRYCNAVTEVVLPDSVTRIEAYAFESCGSLTTLSIPDGITYIGEDAFAYSNAINYYRVGGASYLGNSGNPYLVLCDVPTGIEYFSFSSEYPTRIIYAHAFDGCWDLLSITIPDSVVQIGDYAFNSCESLEEVYLGSSVADIGRYAFNGSREMVTCDLPDSVVSIGDYAFAECEKLSALTLPEGLTYIGERAFYYCISLNGTLTLPGGVTQIGEWAFGNCNELDALVLSDGVERIGDSAFYSCDNLVSITIADSVTELCTDCFGECYYVTDIYYTGSQSAWEALHPNAAFGHLDEITVHCDYEISA